MKLRIDFKYGLRLLVVITLLAFAHEGMAIEFAYVGDNGVPPASVVPTSATISAVSTSATISNSNIPPSGNTNNANALKSFADNLDNWGGVVSPANGLVGNTMSGASNLIKTGFQGNECIDGNNASCVKAANSALETAKDFSSTIDNNLIPGPVNVIPAVINMNAAGQDAVNSIYRGDVYEGVAQTLDFASKGASVVLTLTNPPLGAAYGFGLAAGKVIDKNTGIGDYIGDKAWGLGESAYYSLNPEKDPMSLEFAKKAKQQVFENLKNLNEAAARDQAARDRAAAAQMNQNQTSTGDNLNQVLGDFMTQLNRMQQKQNSSSAQQPLTPIGAGGSPIVTNTGCLSPFVAGGCKSTPVPSGGCNLTAADRAKGKVCTAN